MQAYLDLALLALIQMRSVKIDRNILKILMVI